MPQKSEDTVHILEGKATLYKREGSPFWSVRYKAYGKWERQSTKRGDVDDAKDKAVEIVMNAWFREKNDFVCCVCVMRCRAGLFGPLCRSELLLVPFAISL